MTTSKKVVKTSLKSLQDLGAPFKLDDVLVQDEGHYLKVRTKEGNIEHVEQSDEAPASEEITNVVVLPISIEEVETSEASDVLIEEAPVETELTKQIDKLTGVDELGLYEHQRVIMENVDKLADGGIVSPYTDIHGSIVTGRILEDLREQIQSDENVEENELEEVPSDEHEADMVIDMVIGREDGTVTTVDDYINEIFVDTNVVTEEAVEADDEERLPTREELINELREFYSLMNLPYLEASWSQMTEVQLHDLLLICKANCGGSLDMGTLIKQTEEDYKRFITSEMMKSRMNIIERKSADQAKMIQKFTKMFGNDVIVQGAKSKEYHEMLKGAVQYIVSITSHINGIANQLGITMPAEELFPTRDHFPITENTPADPRVSMYVLNLLAANLGRINDNAHATNKSNASNIKYIERLEQQVKALKGQVELANKDLEYERAEFNRRIGNSAYCIIKDSRGKILRKIDPDKPLTHARDLDLRGDIDTALIINSERAAEVLAERLMSHRKFRDKELHVYNVSIVKKS